MPSHRDWADLEIDAIVADYFEMLAREFRGEHYNKTEHRRALKVLLNNRSDAAIEFKHRNISAILVEAKFPPIEGYKPAFNFQARLAESVLERLDEDAELNEIAREVVDSAPSTSSWSDLLSRIVEPPVLIESIQSALGAAQRKRVARRTDYLAREARNRDLGRRGEEFVAALERARLQANGLSDLARKVEHVAVTQGDGLGFDVLSFADDGRERYIEVKTTQFGAEVPFYVSQSEIDFSAENSDAYDLCRVFTFRSNPRLFRLSGEISSTCQLLPSQYTAWPLSHQ